jgi:Domain of unknown function (DUF4391)
VNLSVIIEALALPSDAKVEQRIPKKLLVEQGAPTAFDKRQIQDGIDELHWVAALKPTNIGVPAFRDSEREYLEVAILAVSYRPEAKVARLTELIHRAVPYPVLLVSTFPDLDAACIGVSAAHKRFAQNEAGKFVVDEVLSINPIAEDAMELPNTQAFFGTLALSMLPTRDLFALYQGWLDSIVGFQASCITGQFAMPKSREETRKMRERMSQYLQILDELSALRTQAMKEKQMNRLVAFNTKIKRLESQLAANQTALQGKPL